MQMMYWAAFAVGLEETVVPLDRWMKALQESGEVTAKCMYGSPQGWVAHGEVARL